jgi:hypothetical protein
VRVFRKRTAPGKISKKREEAVARMCSLVVT